MDETIKDKKIKFCSFHLYNMQLYTLRAALVATTLL